MGARMIRKRICDRLFGVGCSLFCWLYNRCQSVTIKREMTMETTVTDVPGIEATNHKGRRVIRPSEAPCFALHDELVPTLIENAFRCVFRCGSGGVDRSIFAHECRAWDEWNPWNDKKPNK